MKFLYTIFILIIITSYSFAECPTSYDPPGNNHKNTMFYIEKDTNSNVVYYDVNVDKDLKIKRNKPVDVYWQMFEKNGERQELNFFEKKLAYGIIKVREIIPYKKYGFRIISVKREIFVNYDNGCAYAETTINGKLSKLGKISLVVQNTSYLPKLLYLDIYGIDYDTGEEVVERYYHN